MTCGVYEVVNTVNGKRYIGQTTDFKRRWKDHRVRLRGQRHDNKHMQRAWDKYGESTFKFLPILTCQPSMLDFYEQQLLDKVNPEYNIAIDVVASARGLKRGPMSAEQRAKLSAANTGKVQPRDVVEKRAAAMRGRKYAPEHCAAIAAGKIGKKYKPFSAQARENMGASHRGKKHSPEWCAAISAGKRGKPLSDAQREGIRRARTGSKASAETRAKMSAAQTERHRIRRLEATHG